MNPDHPHPFTYHDELVVPVWGEELDLIADLVGFIEDWLRHAAPETIADLNTFPAPDPRHAERVIDELAATCIHLRHLAQKGIA